jgi:hypothetical protein
VKKRHKVGGAKKPAYCIRVGYDFQGGPLRRSALFLNSKGRVVNAIDFPESYSLTQIRDTMNEKYGAREVPCSRIRTAKETPLNR